MERMFNYSHKARFKIRCKPCGFLKPILPLPFRKRVQTTERNYCLEITKIRQKLVVNATSEDVQHLTNTDCLLFLSRQREQSRDLGNQLAQTGIRLNMWTSFFFPGCDTISPQNGYQ